jgi:glycosyltransferase involved in cell wall biosynthesis
LPNHRKDQAASREEEAPSIRPLRLAVLIQLAPRKLGSLEEWLVGLATEARRRGHHFDVFGHEPIHPQVRTELTAAGAGWETVASLTDRPWAAIRRLVRDYDVMHLNFAAPNEKLALLAYAAWPTPILYVDHNSLSAGVTLRRSLLGSAIDHLTRVRMSGMVGVSNYVRDRARARYHVEPPYVATIYNGVNVRRFAPSATPRSETGDVVITAAAYLIAEKGIAGLLQAVALANLPGVRVNIVGDGPEEARLRSLAQSLGLEKVTSFLGLRNDLHEVLRATDIFVHPVLWEEAFGLTIAEAMATGCAVVASRIGAIPELVESGESGVLVPPGDVPALAAALANLVSRPDERHRLSAGALRRAHAHFRLDDSVGAHLDWCERIGAGRRGGKGS